MQLRSCLAVTLLTLSGCAGAQSAACVAPPVSIAVPDPMTNPAAGAANVSTTIGSITAPNVPHLAGLSVILTPSSGSALTGGTFVTSGVLNVTATVPALATNTTYHVTSSPFSSGVPCAGSSFVDLGSFTTGSS